MPLAIRDPLCPLLHQVLIRNLRSSEQRLLLHITDFTYTAESKPVWASFCFVSVLLGLIFSLVGWSVYLIFLSSLNEWGWGGGVSRVLPCVG